MNAYRIYLFAPGHRGIQVWSVRAASDVAALDIAEHVTGRPREWLMVERWL